MLVSRMYLRKHMRWLSDIMAALKAIITTIYIVLAIACLIGLIVFNTLMLRLACLFGLVLFVLTIFIMIYETEYN